jgi:hypothetical protein
MKLPFFYPEHPEFKAHVEYVTKEMWRFHNDADDLKLPYKVAEKRAKDIVLWVGSRRVPWWERLIDKLRGHEYLPVDDRFEAKLERHLRQAIERAKPEQSMSPDDYERVYFKGVDDFHYYLLQELGIDNQQAKVQSESDHPRGTISAGTSGN